jgi:mono/diheme cytochrome c family protein
MTVRAPLTTQVPLNSRPPRSLLHAVAVVAIAAVGAALATAFAATSAPDKSGDVTRGKQLYMATGCYQCHGTRGEGGGNAGPRLAPTPLPLEALKLQLRRPRGRMPLYTANVMPDKDVADIYAYLLSVPQGKAAAEIPMLKALPTGAGSK